MEGEGEGPDTSSIKPISSLRSRFENLGKDRDNGPTSPATAGARLGVNSTTPTTKPKATVGEGKPAGLGLPTVASGHATLTPIPRKPQPQPQPQTPGPRPVSMSMGATSPRHHSPPTLAVTSPRSPRSPQKAFSVDLRPSHGSIPLQPLTPNRTGDSPGKAHARSISRSATPALEARMNAFLHAADIKATPRPEELSNSGGPDVEPFPELKPEAASAPPPVNRAAKPRVPVKPSVLANKTANNLAAPETNAELTDQSASPFSTPPSSRGSSPAISKDNAPKPAGNGNESSMSAANRARQDSDASWVQRIRGDSDASLTERARSGSNASWAEPSFGPDSWTPPAVTRTGTMPARYRNIVGRGGGAHDDIMEDKPRLPIRPELQVRSGRVSPPKTRSGRTSPLKSHMLPPKRSVDGLKRAAADLESGSRIQAAPQVNTRSALTQGFERKGSVASSAAPPIVTRPMQPPAIPAPRRSVDRRREPPPPPSVTSLPTTPISGAARHSKDDYEDFQPQALSREGTGLSDFPDNTRANRRAPKFKQRPWQIPTEYDTRLFAVCGEYVCTTGYITKTWNFRTGEQLLNMEHTQNTKITSVVFKPSPDIEDEGKRIWLGTNAGDIHEVDIPSQSLAKTKSNVHTRREVIRMFRYASELWTLDDGGDLYVWKPDHKGMPSLDSQHNNWRLPKGHSFSIASGRQLWYATGKDIRVYMPSANSDTEFQLTRSPLSQSGTGDVTSGATLNHQPDLIFFGHSDGKCSIYNRRDFSCQAIVNVSVYRISSLAGVGEYLWAGYSTGMAYVYDTSTTPWTVKKDWKAHDKQICSIIADPSAMWKMGRLNVITLGLDNLLRIWDGMLQEDWLEARMSTRDSEFCSFRELTAAVLTWNAGAAKPTYLQHSRDDRDFFRDYLSSSRRSPDIFIFGFQELVDLEDKKVTAKSFFKKSKKEPDEQQHMSHQYRAWRDHLGKCIDDYMPTDQTYTLLHTASMVGLFTCVFVKSAERSRIRYVHTAEVKRGMGGRHGNKGAIIVRMVLDDSSMCFVNCHLAAGQTQTTHRNNDIAEILEANALPPYPLNEGEVAEHSDVFASGGDGSMIMDHEICILNGDLNYRIDTMGRDSVIKHIQQGNLAKLLDRDQLLLSRRKNPGFRLRAFQESPINFAPTYKYNVHTDDYDTSEKRRSPAWCDRILYRGLGKVKIDEYRRWDQIRVSDHRPVSGHFRLRVKSVDADKREIVWEKCVKEFGSVRQRIAKAAQLEYLTNVLGLTQKEAVTALQGSS